MVLIFDILNIRVVFVFVFHLVTFLVILNKRGVIVFVFVSHLVALFDILNDRGVLVLCHTGGLILGLAYLSKSDEPWMIMQILHLFTQV